MIANFNIISKKTRKNKHKRKTRWISKAKEFRRNIKGCFCSQNLIRLQLSFNSTEIERYKLSLSISRYILVADPTPPINAGPQPHRIYPSWAQDHCRDCWESMIVNHTQKRIFPPLKKESSNINTQKSSKK